MSDVAKILTAATLAAASDGIETVPEALLNLLAAQTDPVSALADWDRSNEFFKAVETQFPFVPVVRVTGQPRQPRETERLSELLRWFIRELCEWRKTEDPRHQRLTALIVTAQFCDWDHKIWERLPDEISANEELLAAFENIVRGVSVSFGTRPSRPSPIWETETVEAFRQADTEGDWAAIASMWRQFENAVMPSIVVAQSVSFLARYDLNGLVRAVSGIHQTPTAMAIARYSPALPLGAASENPFIQFAAVYQAGSRSPNAADLSEADQDALTSILMKVASDGPRWSKWMQAFNRWPERFPRLQVSLGQALAIAPDASIAAYVQAMSLSTSVESGCRQFASLCLRTFREAAPIDRRKRLWELAFERWRQWQFGSDEQHTTLLNVGYSELDLAVVGFCVECLDAAERNAAVEKALATIMGVDEAWYGGITEFHEAWNRALSELQPYVHAQKVTGTQLEWLMRAQHYLPFDPNTDRYNAMKFSIPIPS